MIVPELGLSEREPLSPEEAHDSLEAVYWSRWPDLAGLESDQTAKWLIQAAIEENQIPQKLTQVVESLGSRADELGQRSISSPDFHLTLYLRRISDEELVAVPSLLHSQLKNYFGVSIPVLIDGSLDPSREIVVNWHRHNSIEDSPMVFPIIAARAAYSLGLPLSGWRPDSTAA